MSTEDAQQSEYSPSGVEKTFKVVVLGFVLLLQLLLVLPRAGNLAKEPYRREERAAALKAMADNPTPATKTAFHEEQLRVIRYTTRRDLTRSGLMFAGFLLLDGFVIWWLQKGRVKTTNQQEMVIPR